MKMPLPKLKATILYFCSNTNPAKLGKVKLMKLFYFLDFVHLKQYGTPVTYDQYYHLPYGPIPTVIKNFVDGIEEKDSPLLDTIKIEVVKGRNLKKVVPLGKFDEKDKAYFTKSELKVLEDVSRRFKDSDKAQIEKAAQDEAPYSKTHLADRISYALAAQDADSVVAEEDIQLLIDAFS